MFSLAVHCGVERVCLAVQVPYGAVPLLYPGTKVQFVCHEPWYFTQWPAVSTTLLFPLVTASPEHAAFCPLNVKKTRPTVWVTAPPPVQGPPPNGSAAGVTDGAPARTASSRVPGRRVS